jgi:hypothetical protein
MFCRKCGADNADNAYRCVQCGETLAQASGVPTNIPNYLVQSILVTIFCCLPLGIPAIVFAAQVNGKLAAGDVQGALNASKNAKMWSWISFGCGIAMELIIVAFYALAIMAAISNAQHGMRPM